MEKQEHPVILFDGVCNLCNFAVDFVIRRDPAARFRFASLQDEFGQRVLEENGLPSTELSTFILVERDRIYTKSTAALRVARHLGALWPVTQFFLIVPRPIRDWIYKLIANNRYRLFGKKETCRLPSPEEKARFL